MIQSIIDWLVNAISTIGYPGVFISVFLESFFAPIPSEIILPFSGFVASTGKMDLVFVIVIATVAAYLGSLLFTSLVSGVRSLLLTSLINMVSTFLFNKRM